MAQIELRLRDARRASVKMVAASIFGSGTIDVVVDGQIIVELKEATLRKSKKDGSWYISPPARSQKEGQYQNQSQGQATWIKFWYLLPGMKDDARRAWDTYLINQFLTAIPNPEQPDLSRSQPPQQGYGNQGYAPQPQYQPPGYQQPQYQPPQQYQQPPPQQYQQPQQPQYPQQPQQYPQQPQQQPQQPPQGAPGFPPQAPGPQGPPMAPGAPGGPPGHPPMPSPGQPMFPPRPQGPGGPGPGPHMPQGDAASSFPLPPPG